MTGNFLSIHLSAVAIIAACSSALGQTPSAVQPRGDGEIHGRIVAAGDKPIANATVEITTAGATTPPRRVSTSADGAFRIQGLRPATYRVHVRAFGYTPREFPSTLLSASSPSVD